MKIVDRILKEFKPSWYFENKIERYEISPLLLERMINKAYKLGKKAQPKRGRR